MPRLATAAVLFAALASPARADDPPPGKRLYAHLEAQAKTHFDARRKAVAALKTPDAIRARQFALRVAFREALGDLPAEKTPLHASSEARRFGTDVSYSLEKVVYESRPGHHVTATLYLPSVKKPVPAVLIPCGHSENGKADPSYQSMAILLARNGIASLCFDPIGQGERVQWLGGDGKPARNGSTTEHTLEGLGAWFVGRSVAGYRYWDAVRSLDYLANRTEVDPARLGCTGNSGGGTETSYLMALDDRVAVAAPSCYITSWEQLLATIGPQDGEQNVTGQIALGIDHADYLTMRAPKPTMVCAGTRDFFDIDGTWDSFREAKRVYSALGAGERVDLFESDETHGLTRPRRESCALWMRRWLLGKDEPLTEPELAVAAEAELRCTETGQVLTQFHDASVFDLNAARAQDLAVARASRKAKPAGLLAEVRRKIGLDDGPVPPAEPAGRNAWKTEPGVVLPVEFTTGEPRKGRPLTVIVGGDRKAVTAAGGPAEAEAKSGRDVALVDLRGLGSLSPGEKGGMADALGADWKEALLSVDLNRPLLGQRVFDLLAVVARLTDGDASPDVHLVGLDEASAVALHAAALEPRIGRVTLDGLTLSWAGVASAPSRHARLAEVVPGALAAYDLPELAATIAPRPLAIRSPRGAGDVTPTQDRLDDAYAACRSAYAAASAADKLTLKAGR